MRRIIGNMGAQVPHSSRNVPVSLSTVSEANKRSLLGAIVVVKGLFDKDVAYYDHSIPWTKANGSLHVDRGTYMGSPSMSKKQQRLRWRGSVYAAPVCPGFQVFLGTGRPWKHFYAV